MSSACRNRSDRDAPSNAEPEEGEIPQHSRDLEGDIRRLYEQPWQRDLRLRQRDDWYSDASDQESVSGAARSGNREPRYYRDSEIPVSRMEVLSSRQPHGEQVTDSRDFPVKITRHDRSTCDFQHDLEDEARPSFSTIVAHDVGPENGICGLSSDRVVNPSLSTIGATERGAKIGIESTNDAQHGFRDGANPQLSTISPRRGRPSPTILLLIKLG